MGLEIQFSDEDKKKAIEQYQPRKVYYEPIGNEEILFDSARKAKQAIAIIGPTGSGKSRFFESMAFKYKRPFILIPGEESTDAGTVVGSPYVVGNKAAFIPGPLYIGASIDAFTALEEILEMRKDVLPFLHPLTDKRRRLIIPEINKVIEPGEGFMLAVFFNPGSAYQAATNVWPKPSFIQRFTVIELGYARGEKGKKILMSEAKIDEKLAGQLDKLATEIDSLHAHNKFPHMKESVGYHALIKAGEQIREGSSKKDACRACISSVLSHDKEVVQAIDDLVKKIIG